jgi:hypothetical protein
MVSGYKSIRSLLRFCMAIFTASVCRRRLSEVRDAVLELFLLVGADKEELRAGTGGRPKVEPFVSLFSGKGRKSNTTRLPRPEMSTEPLPWAGAVVGRRLESCERVRDWFLLLEAEDFREDRRSGITTTGMISGCWYGIELVTLALREISEATH